MDIENQRSIEEKIITSHMVKFKRFIQNFAWRLEWEDRNDFESQAYYYLFQEVRKYLEEWQNELCEWKLFYIARNAFYYILRRKYKRRDLFFNMLEHAKAGRRII
ncbi:MAG: hypothetical protein LBU89_00725 [Fibromonadaceae bacterium]|jgi:hypothetical protein|nr:hypothetical protein [Fibromonadaceae bacterium]